MHARALFAFKCIFWLGMNSPGKMVKNGIHMRTLWARAIFSDYFLKINKLQHFSELSVKKLSKNIENCDRKPGTPPHLIGDVSIPLQHIFWFMINFRGRSMYRKGYFPRRGQIYRCEVNPFKPRQASKVPPTPIKLVAVNNVTGIFLILRTSCIFE